MDGKKNRLLQSPSDAPEVASIQPYLFLPKAEVSIPSNSYDDTVRRVCCAAKLEALKT